MKQSNTLQCIFFVCLLLISCFAYADTVSNTTVTNTTEDVTPADKTTTTQTTTTVTVSDTDAKIIAAIYDKYAKAPALTGTTLAVTSSDGNVTISGTVTMQSQEDAAIQAAKSVEGVKSVVSTINVTTRAKPIQAVPNKNY